MIMTWSGILIYWANDAYISIPKNTARFLGIEEQLAEGMGWHFFLMWPFIINGCVYVLYLLFSKEWREIFPDKNSFREAIQVTLYDLKISKVAPTERGKFNGAQKFAYTGVMILAMFSVLSGLAIYKPVQLGLLTKFFGGYEGARLVHFICMISICGFFFIHIVQVLKAGWNNLRAMIAGYEIRNEKK